MRSRSKRAFAPPPDRARHGTGRASSALRGAPTDGASWERWPAAPSPDASRRESEWAILIAPDLKSGTLLQVELTGLNAVGAGVVPMPFLHRRPDVKA